MQKSIKLQDTGTVASPKPVRIISITAVIKLRDKRLDAQAHTHTHGDTLRAQKSHPSAHQLKMKNRLTIEMPEMICNKLSHSHFMNL